MAPPLAGAAIEPDEPANKATPATNRAEQPILMTASSFGGPAHPGALLAQQKVRSIVPSRRADGADSRGVFASSRNRFAHAAFASGTARRRNALMKRLLLATAAVALLVGP